MGIGTQPQPDGAPDQNMVPKSADEEQEKQPKTDNSKQQQQ